MRPASAFAFSALLGSALASGPAVASEDAASDVPLRNTTVGRPVLLAQASVPSHEEGLVPSSLQLARRLSSELRYEEAVVEYQRYLGLSGRPTSERAQAMFELAFINSILGDDVTARRLGLDALSSGTDVRPPPDSPRKWTEFLEQMRRALNEQVQLQLQVTEGAPPERVVVRLVDPGGRAKQVLLRHALSADGPYFSTVMRCRKEAWCSADIPPSGGSGNVLVYYFVEALDEAQNTLASAASPQAPLRVSLVQGDNWYASPWLWGGAAVTVVAGAALYFFVTAPAK